MSALSSSAAIRGATSHRPSALRVHPRRRTQRAARPRAAAPTRDVSLPTWDALEARIASDWPGWHRWVAQEAWRVVDCAVGGRLDDPIPPPVPDGVTALFRDRNGWCPYSERVWCGLMVARVPFVEVLVDNQVGRASCRVDDGGRVDRARVIHRQPTAAPRRRRRRRRRSMLRSMPSRRPENRSPRAPIFFNTTRHDMTTSSKARRGPRRPLAFPPSHRARSLDGTRPWAAEGPRRACGGRTARPRARAPTS